MQASNGILTDDQRLELHQRGWTAFGKRVHARIERNRTERRHDNQRYAIFVEHDSIVVDENGEKGDPVAAVIVTAPNIRAARKKVVEDTPFHIRRFLHWKYLPLYPTDEADD